FVERGRHEPLGAGEDRDLRHPRTPLPFLVARDRFPGRSLDVVADDARALLAGDGDDRGALGRRHVGVVDDDVTPGGERGAQERVLPHLLAAHVGQRVLADVLVRGKTVAIERGLPRAGQSYENHDLGPHPSMLLGAGPSTSLGAGPSTSLGAGAGRSMLLTAR